MKKVFISKPNHHKAGTGPPGTGPLPPAPTSVLGPGPGLGPPTSVLGLGDAMKRVTTAVGIKPCEGCKKRAEALNKWTLRLRRK